MGSAESGLLNYSECSVIESAAKNHLRRRLRALDLSPGGVPCITTRGCRFRRGRTLPCLWAVSVSTMRRVVPTWAISVFPAGVEAGFRSQLRAGPTGTSKPDSSSETPAREWHRPDAFTLGSPGESHPEALPEPYVSVSTHTAPMVNKPTTLALPKRKQVRLTIDNVHQPVPCPTPMFRIAASPEIKPPICRIPLRP